MVLIGIFLVVIAVMANGLQAQSTKVITVTETAFVTVTQTVQPSTGQSSTSTGGSSTATSTSSTGGSSTATSSVQPTSSTEGSSTGTSTGQSSTSTVGSSTATSTSSTGGSFIATSSVQPTSSTGGSSTGTSTGQSSTSTGGSSTATSTSGTGGSSTAASSIQPTSSTGGSSTGTSTGQSTSSTGGSSTGTSTVQPTASTGGSSTGTSTATSTSSSTTPTSTISPTPTTTTSSTAVPTTTTTVPTTTTVAVSQINPLARFFSDFVMKINYAYDSDIENPTADAYKNLVKSVISFLQQIMKFVFNVVYEVSKIKQGSAIVDVKMSISLADLKKASASSGASFNLSAMILAAVNNASKYNVTVDGKPVDYAGMVASLQTGLLKPYSPCDSNPCKPGHKCIDLQPSKPYAFDFACQSKCKDYSCGIYSECLLDKEGEPYCVYAESSLMLFIGIAIGVCFAFIIILGIICLICRWRKTDKTSYRKEDGESFSAASRDSPETAARNTAFVDNESSTQYDHYGACLGQKDDSLSKALKIPRPKVTSDKLGLHELPGSQQSLSSRTKGTNTDV